MLEEWLQEAAVAAAKAKRTVVLIVIPEGVKVWAPAHGRMTQEVIVSWEELRDSLVNPLLRPIAEVERTP